MHVEIKSENPKGIAKMFLLDVLLLRIQWMIVSKSKGYLQQNTAIFIRVFI